MTSSSQHLSLAAIVDLADKKLTADDQIASHLSDCGRCATELRRCERVIGLMREDHSVDAPRDVLAYAVGLFRQRAAAHEPSLLRRIVAALTFDSSMNLAPGVRSGQSASRQLLYSAGESEIDLRISSQKDQWIVAGQLLGQDCLGGRVEIEGESGLAAAEFNELCEFTLPPIATGSYTLRLRFRDVEVEIPQLELRA